MGRSKNKGNKHLPMSELITRAPQTPFQRYRAGTSLMLSTIERQRYIDASRGLVHGEDFWITISGLRFNIMVVDPEAIDDIWPGGYVGDIGWVLKHKSRLFVGQLFLFDGSALSFYRTGAPGKLPAQEEYRDRMVTPDAYNNGNATNIRPEWVRGRVLSAWERDPKQA